jgi:hypothetical protein
MSQAADQNSPNDVMMYRGKYYYRHTLPSRALNRTKNGYNLYKVENGILFLEVLE